MVKYGKIYPVSFGFAFGILSGLGMMLLAWAGARWGVAVPFIHVMGQLYRHYDASFVGGLWGFFWGFLHSFVFGLLAALIYNCSCCWFCPAGSCDSECGDSKCCK